MCIDTSIMLVHLITYQTNLMEQLGIADTDIPYIAHTLTSLDARG